MVRASNRQRISSSVPFSSHLVACTSKGISNSTAACASAVYLSCQRIDDLELRAESLQETHWSVNSASTPGVRPVACTCPLSLPPSTPGIAVITNRASPPRAARENPCSQSSRPQPGLPGMACLAGIRLPRVLRGSPCHHHDSQAHRPKYQPDYEEHDDPRRRTAGVQYHKPDHSRGKQKDNQPEREDTAAGKPVFISPNQF